MIAWKNFENLSQLEEVDLLSNEGGAVIFKHSTTCSISAMAKMRLENNWDLDVPVFYLDLKSYREISNAITERYSVHHESPQLLFILNGDCVYDASHFDISVDELKEAIAYESKL